MLRKFDHVQLSIPKVWSAPDNVVERDVMAFYGAVLGLTRVPKPPRLQLNGGYWFRNDHGVQVHLGEEDSSFVPARKAHPAFIVDDFTVLIDRLKAADIVVVPDNEIEGITRSFCADPFGNRIELIDATSDALRVGETF